MNKRVLFIINTMGRAGAETALVNLMNVLVSMGEYDLSLYAIIPRGELFGRVPKEVRILNRRYSSGSVLSPCGRMAIAGQVVRAFFHRCNGIKMLPGIVRNIVAQNRGTHRVQLDKVLWRLLSVSADDLAQEYDLAVAYIEGAATYYLAEKVRARKKAAFVHIDYQKAGYTPLMDQGCYDRMDRIFTVSDEVKEGFCAVYSQHREKVFLFRNLLDTGRIRAMAQEAGFDDGFDGIRLVTVGRLHYQKGYDIAIEACARLRALGYDVRWNVLGEGPERANLKKLIAQHGMQDHFVLMGAVDNPYPYINEATIYVHATRFEGKSIAVEEAQVLGKTIVASDCTGNREQIVHDVDGLLVPLSVDNLTDMLKYALDHPEICERLRRNVAKKQLDHPEDVQGMLALLQ